METASARVGAGAGTDPETLGGMFLSAFERHTGPALRWKEEGRWADMSYGAFGNVAREIARGLIARGIERGDRVAILSNTRPEWTLADAGIMCAGAVTAPIYQTNSPEECRYVLEHSDARLVFCEDEDQLSKIAGIRDDCPALETVVLLTGEAPGAISLAELRTGGYDIAAEEVDARVHGVHPGDMASLVYTSGTTGPPKGCVLTHANWIATARMYRSQLQLDGRMLVYMFLPLAHSLARGTQMVAVDTGATIAYWQRDSRKLLDDLREVRPTHLPSVPRVFEKVFTAARSDASGPRALLMRWAVATGRRSRERERSGAPAGRLMRHAQSLADRVVLSRVRGIFGGNLELALTGAAPIGRDVLEFFDACGIPLLEGYGLSESTAAGTLNTPRDYRLGTVGRALPGTEMRIADDGEVLLHGPNVFNGYFKDPDATREVLEADGWLHTGDLGSVDDGYLTITGRKKDIIITSSGKNIAPANIENALKGSRWISEAIVYGDNRPYLVALVGLDTDEAPALAERAGAAPDIASMASDPRVREEIQREVDAVNARFARIEQVKRFVILDHAMSQAGGELTPTMKVRRRAVHERYAGIIEKLYE